MCPSYMATKEEMHSTRGRAHLLWEMLQGDVIDEGWKSDHVREALDLCLACKGCKKDCPVNVDMATYKAEFLSHYYEGRLRPRSAYAFGLIDQWARIASRMPGLVNLATQTPGLRNIAKFVAGMPQERKIPEFAPHTFQSWAEKQNGSRRSRVQFTSESKRVVLWPDTFNNYFFPDTAQAAYELLEKAGFEVVVPRRHVCCGRPLYDFGMLDLAKQYLRRILTAMENEINAGTPFVVLEPSCASVFRDELHGLFPNDELAKKLQGQTYAFSEFLEQKAKHFPLPKLHRKAVVQGHCHHKSILNMDSEEKILKRMEMDPEVMNTGCCGMAGSFGFEKEKYEVSIQVGEQKLFPRIRDTEFTSVIVADGFSCREQIAQGTNRQALHLAEVLKLAQDTGTAGPRGLWPEKELADKRKRERARARARAAIGLAAFGLAAGAAVWMLMRTHEVEPEEELSVA